MARWVEHDGERVLAEVYEERLHPRGRGGRWIGKLVRVKDAEWQQALDKEATAGKVIKTKDDPRGTMYLGGDMPPSRTGTVLSVEGDKATVKFGDQVRNGVSLTAIEPVEPTMGVDQPADPGPRPANPVVADHVERAWQEKRRRDAATGLTPTERAYVEAALWSSIDEQPDGNGGPPMDENYSVEDLAPETVARMRKDFNDFVAANSDDLDGLDLEQVAHDLWLTRNRHGAGFWDRGLGPRGDRLTAAAHAMGEQWLYVGDDGKIYLEGGNIAESKLTMEDRKALPKSAFVFPEKAPAVGAYPIHDLAHARNALARSSGKVEEAAVKAAVYSRYPQLKKVQEAPMEKSRWVEKEGQRFLVEADGKCTMPHKAMSKRGKTVCPNCKAKIGDLESTEEDAKEKVEEARRGQVTDQEIADEARRIEEAADSLIKASTHKHGLEKTPGKQDNWVERTGAGGKGGQLPAYIQHIALALKRKRGMPTSQAIAIAIGTVKRWARGGGNVDANTRAAAAKALAEWAAMKSKAHIKSAVK